MDETKGEGYEATWPKSHRKLKVFQVLEARSPDGSPSGLSWSDHTGRHGLWLLTHRVSKGQDALPLFLDSLLRQISCKTQPLLPWHLWAPWEAQAQGLLWCHLLRVVMFWWFIPFCLFLYIQRSYILFLLNLCIVFFFFSVQEGLRKYGSQLIVEAAIQEHSINWWHWGSDPAGPRKVPEWVWQALRK